MVALKQRDVVLNTDKVAEQERKQPAQIERSWLDRREQLVQKALDDDDHDMLRQISALPGGFGTEDMRRTVWPVLLRSARYFAPAFSGVKEDDTQGRRENETTSPSPNNTQQPHPDEGQVLLDTKRSFVVYPKGLPPQSKLAMQADLQSLIVHVLRTHPTLSYFQGFHDIMSVLYLTFIPIPPPPTPRSRSSSQRRKAGRSGGSTPRETLMTPKDRDGASMNGEATAIPAKIDVDHLRGRPETRVEVDEDKTEQELVSWETLRQCAEIVSALRVRDAMGQGMEPMMGLLKLLRRLLRAADPELYHFSSSISPVPTLPFFALSWILCLFSHDADTLEPVQRMFDFLLARNPVSAIYLAVAILMAKKGQMLQLAQNLRAEIRDDPSSLHPLFARLPPLHPDTPEGCLPLSITDADDEMDPNPYDPIPLSQVFNMTDDLLARFPWDGKVIRGKEVMGPASVLYTYDEETPQENAEKGTDGLSLETGAGMVNQEVVRSGAAEINDEEVEQPSRLPMSWRSMLRMPPSRIGTVLAVGVVFVGIAIAAFGIRTGGTHRGWAGWWGASWL